MKPGAIEVTMLSDEQLKNLIVNRRRKLATDSLTYLDALAEQARRNGQGLDFNKSFSIIRRASSREQLDRRPSSRFVLEIDIGQRLPIVVTHDKTGGLFLGGPRWRESGGSASALFCTKPLWIKPQTIDRGEINLRR